MIAPRLSLFASILLLALSPCAFSQFLYAQRTPSSPEHHVAQGNHLLALGHTEEARKAFHQAIDMNDTLTTAYLGLARADLNEKMWDEAIDRLNEVMRRAPDNVEAHYLRAIAHRELAKFRTLTQARHWNRAEADFEWVVQHDSLYRDVLYQYALLRRYHEAYTEAIACNDAQIRLKPDLVEAQHGHFQFYRSFLNHTAPDEALAWLQTHPSPYAEYFIGEIHRRAGRLQEADAAFTRLLIRPLPFPVQPVWLSRARIAYQDDQPEQAQDFVEQAIAQIADSLDAAMVFDDFKYIISDEELALYRALRTPEAYKAFFRAFWARRNPLPARPLNTRLAEHYRRLLIAEREYAYDGFRLWYSDPDRRGELDFPEAYALNQEFNDKGLIFIRHGEPDDREAQVGGTMEFRTVINNTDVYGTPAEYSYNAGWRPNESWRYERPRRMDFHFVVDEGGGANNWRLTPALTHFGMLESRERWGAPYSEMTQAARAMEEIQGNKESKFSASTAGARSFDEALTDEEAQRLDSLNAQQLDLSKLSEQNRNMLEFTTLRHRMVEQSRQAVTLGLTTDQHSWEEEEAALIPMPYVPVAFQGKGGQTRVEIHFALPIGIITNAMDAAHKTLDIEVGYAVHDTAWHEVTREVDTKQVPATTDETAALIDFYQFTVPPDSYHVSLHGYSSEAVRLGGDKFGYRVPDYSRPTLAVSDLLLSDYIGPARGSRFDRGELHVSPNPFQRFSTEQLVFVYFEVYHLTLDEDDRTRFTVEYTLTPQQPKKTLGLFGRKNRPTLSLRVERSGEDPSPVEWAEIDVGKVDPGDYLLTVTISDQLTGATREQSRPLTLYKYE